jgi:hypothetical protein
VPPAPRYIVVPTHDLIGELKQALIKYTISDAGFEEIVRQCLDVYLDWKGNDEEIFSLPYFNRIEIPELRKADHHNVRETIQHAVHTFARSMHSRFTQKGVFPKSHTPTDLSYAFERFVGQDIALFYLEF